MTVKKAKNSITADKRNSSSPCIPFQNHYLNDGESSLYNIKIKQIQGPAEEFDGLKTITISYVYYTNILSIVIKSYFNVNGIQIAVCTIINKYV